MSVSSNSLGMRKYALSDPTTRKRVEAALRTLGDCSERPEQSCVYRFDFTCGAERVVVKQYTNGTLFLQSAGAPGPLFAQLTAAVEQAGSTSTENLHPSSSLHRPLSGSGPRGASFGIDVEHPFDTPWIGSDESGKGDYFGPLVACAVWVDERILALLETLGIRDSKRLSDAQNRRLAQEVRAVCGDRCGEVLVPPERYNALYEQFRGEGKNLNALLAWGHARAIETVLEHVSCENVIVDQFADARYIRARLEARERTRHLNIVQLPRAEANTAVAAASVLARDRFLSWLDHAARQYGMAFPKGASSEVEAAARQFVSRHGPQALSSVAKLHFKTTSRVLQLAIGGQEGT
ncbi:MAG TPA: ribonuclease HIII [Chloroflexota bacterium]|nr:ribonuclease HIII [Chloroflexota bacterium]